MSERKCRVFVQRQKGQDPVLIIQMNSKYNWKNKDIFQMHFSKPKDDYMIRKEIRLPQKPKNKKDSENEEEYKMQENNAIINEIKPWQTAGPYTHATWDFMIKKWFPRKWNHVITYDDIFKVVVFERQGFGTAYMFDNEFDRKVEWYKIGMNEIRPNVNQ